MSPRDLPATGLSKRAFSAQRNNAKQRGIEFRFIYEQWVGWWQRALAYRGPTAERGRGRLQWQMCRFNDQGAYEIGNVYCGNPMDNTTDMRRHPPKQRSYWLSGKTGAAHPRSTPVTTPDGNFPSITAAADYYGISRTQMRRHLVTGRYPASTT